MEKNEERIEVEEGKKKNHFFINFLIFIVVLLTGIILYSRYLGTRGLIVKEYRVESNILTSNFSGIKIVHFSDLLYKSTIYKDDIPPIIDRINELRPDIIVFTGDLVSKGIKINEEEKEFLISELSKLNASIGKYAIYGDSDYSCTSYEEIMSSSSFQILNNSYDEVYYESNDPMYIVGLPSSIKESTDLDSSFAFYKDEDRHYIIVLTHDGNTIKALDSSTYEVDLILAGHSIGGSVKLPFYGPLFTDKTMYKYYDDYYKKGITNIYVSSGLGTDKYSYRFLNKPSFNLYRLKAQS